MTILNITDNSTLPDFPDISDEPFQEDFTSALIILISPFILVPLLIILFRIVKFSIKIIKASLVGRGKVFIECWLTKKKKLKIG